MDSGHTGQGKRVVGLFLAAALALTPGCSLNPFASDRNDRFCNDDDQDGRCDEDGQGYHQNRSGFWGPWWWGGIRSSSPGVSPSHDPSSGISTGAKGGIGSSSRSGGGSSGG